MGVRKVLLIGGSGFLGSWLCSCLSRSGIRVLVPVRHRDHAKSLTLLPLVDPVAADVHDPQVLRSLMADVDAVINLVGILHDRDSREPYGKRFFAAHVELPGKIVEAMKQVGVRRLVHVSALRAESSAPSAYLRSKAAGEAILLAASGDLDVTIFRPSVIFGANDAFLNTFASLLGKFPVLPLGCAEARFQPVYVGDVAEVLAGCINRPETFGGVYELCGPRVYSLRQLVEYTASLLGRRPLIIPLPEPLAYLQATLLSLLPVPLMSPDNLRSMQLDSVGDGQHDYPGWQPRPLEALAPTWLATLKPKSRFDAYRSRAGR